MNNKFKFTREDLDRMIERALRPSAPIAGAGRTAPILDKLKAVARQRNLSAGSRQMPKRV